MKNWKVTIEYAGKIMSVMIEASSYADAYVKIETAYQGCVVKSITEIRDKEKDNQT
jgi:hypothetical protein